MYVLVIYYKHYNKGGHNIMSGIVGQNLGRGSGLVKVTAVDADAVTGASIADDAIDSEHYTDGSIDNAHIADDAIDSEHYAAASIDNAHLADDAVDSDELAAGAVDTAHIGDNQVTLAKMAGLARGKLIYGDASGDPAALAVGSADQLLTHDGTDLAWADAAAGGGITHINEWRLNTNFQGDLDPILNWTSQGGLGSVLTLSSGVFTFPATGFWLVLAKDQFFHTSYDSKDNTFGMKVTTDDSTYATSTQGDAPIDVELGTNTPAHVFVSDVVDVTSVSNVKVSFFADCSSSTTNQGLTNINATYVCFIRLADT